MEAMIRAGDASRRLVPYADKSIVYHNRVVSTYRSRIDKYRRRGVRIFDEIEVIPEMLKQEQLSVATSIPYGLPCKIQGLTSNCMVGVTVVHR